MFIVLAMKIENISPSFERKLQYLSACLRVLKNTERTLTAAAGPPPRDPYRQALTMRPSLRARPLVS